ncbi:MAG: efflux RND transporter periplasmic adaptor subunit [Pirellulaceae bacterium]|nr:efflux RND transporter periplasmic adaptor subunit [Pirellulaceae bacterium]
MPAHCRHRWTFLLVLLATAGCNKESATKPKKIEPAHVDHHVDETSLNTITLTSQAEARLGIQLADVQQRSVVRHRKLSGNVIVPPGKTIIVTAPIAGTLQAPKSSDVPTPGESVKQSQIIFRFQPLLSAERDVLTPSERVRMAQTKADVATLQLEAKRQIESAKVQVQAAQIQLDRATQLFQSKAGSQRVVDEAAAQLKLSETALQTAQQRSKFLAGIDLEQSPGQLDSRDITTPVDGVLQSVDAAKGETVATGDVLFSVVSTDQVWIRVPVYVGNWREIDTSKPAQVTEFGNASGVEAQSAKYVSAPPSADALAATVNLFYELDNSDGRLYPGQRLSVLLPLTTSGEKLIVPYRGVLYDVQGDSWVYVQQSANRYARQRISIDYVDGEHAIVLRGVQPGQKVVTDGAAELFGTEFGVGH